MRHHAFPAAIGFSLAAALVCVSSLPADAASPYGYWRKAQQGEHPAKMQVYRCGRSLCVKIAWLQNPNDSQGRPLRDVRNSNTGLRGRAIQGLHIVKGMQPVKANQWKGSIYNPEDGNTYSATLTLASSNKIVLKGCKAFLLCAERVWVRTSAPPKEEPKPEPQIEASAEPAPAIASANAAAGVAPPQSKEDTLGEAEMLTPAAAAAAQPGYRYLNGSQAAGAPEEFSGENVPSMFAMTTPLEGATAPATPEAKSAPPPQPKPQATAPAPKPPAPVAATPKPQPAPRAAPATPSEPAPAPEPVETAETEEPAPPPTTAAATADQPSLTWRERRQIRRQERARQGSQGFFPWGR